jgi:hypothetical protein
MLHIGGAILVRSSKMLRRPMTLKATTPDKVLKHSPDINRTCASHDLDQRLGIFRLSFDRYIFLLRFVNTSHDGMALITTNNLVIALRCVDT